MSLYLRITVTIVLLLNFQLMTPFLKASLAKKEKKSEKSPPAEDQVYQQYLEFFEEVYETMTANYYLPVERKDYEGFIEKLNAKIYSNLKEDGKSTDYIKWRSAAYLVEYLKSHDDTFSAFYPPKPAKEYEQTVLGKRIDLGIEGKLIPEGYLVVRIEPR